MQLLGLSMLDRRRSLRKRISHILFMAIVLRVEMQCEQLLVVSFAPVLPWKHHYRVRCHAKRRSKHNSDVLWVEKRLQQDRGFFPILGSDESGRGSVAGPIVTATCAIVCDWKDYTPIAAVKDSKQLTPNEREEIHAKVVSQPEIYLWSIAERSHASIDECNIQQATMQCFADSIKQVVAQLPESHNAYSIVDGKKGPKLTVNIPSRPWIQGDKEVYSVALASILAKVSRDRMALEWHKLYPKYGFDIHKGYATDGHIEAIHRHGPCPIHRLSFKSLKGRWSHDSEQ